MDESLEAGRSAELNWLTILKSLSGKEHANIRIQILETIAFDPATLLLKFWAYSDASGVLRRYEKKSLLWTDIVSACLRAILSPSEIDLYQSEVARCSGSELMVRAI